MQSSTTRHSTQRRATGSQRKRPSVPQPPQALSSCMGGGGGGTGSVVLAGADALGAMVKLGVGTGAVTEAVAVDVGVGSTTVLPGSEGSPHAANDEKTT